MKTTPPLEMWIVHDRLADGVVACKWLVRGGTFQPSPDEIHAASLNDVRAKLPPGLTRRERAPEDAPSIVEIWV